MSKLSQRDLEHLEWIESRLVNVYGESENVDFVIRLREIRKALAENPPAERTDDCGGRCGAFGTTTGRQCVLENDHAGPHDLEVEWGKPLREHPGWPKDDENPPAAAGGRSMCEVCDGTGKTDTTDPRCSVCGGVGTVANYVFPAAAGPDDALAEQFERGYKQGWKDREADIVERTERIKPADAGETLESQVKRLADFIMQEIPGEPSQSEGAIDCAIRLLRAAAGEGRHCGGCSGRGSSGYGPCPGIPAAWLKEQVERTKKTLKEWPGWLQRASGIADQAEDGIWDEGLANVCEDHLLEAEKRCSERDCLDRHEVYDGIPAAQPAVDCDHKFIDSKFCLKCGWTPAQPAAIGCPDCMYDESYPDGPPRVPHCPFHQRGIEYEPESKWAAQPAVSDQQIALINRLGEVAQKHGEGVLANEAYILAARLRGEGK